MNIFLVRCLFVCLFCFVCFLFCFVVVVVVVVVLFKPKRRAKDYAFLFQFHPPNFLLLFFFFLLFILFLFFFSSSFLFSCFNPAFNAGRSRNTTELLPFTQSCNMAFVVTVTLLAAVVGAGGTLR